MSRASGDRDIGKLYDCSVDAYDKLYYSEQNEKYKSIRDNINVIGCNFVDLGVGTGLYFENFLCESIYLIGIDLSIKSLYKAYGRGLKYYVDLIYSDAQYPPIRLDSIDVLMSVTTVHHFKDIELFISRIMESEVKHIFISFLEKVFSEDYIKALADRFRCSYWKVANDYMLYCSKI